MTHPALGFGLSFPDLYHRDGMERIDAAFLDELGRADGALRDRLLAARAAPETVAGKAESELIIALAPHLDDFLSALFGIRAAALELRERHHALAPLYQAKRMFVQRRAVTEVKPDEAATLDADALALDYSVRTGETFSELGFARRVLAWLDDEANHGDDLAFAARLAAAKVAQTGRAVHPEGVLFRLPGKHDPLALVAVEPVDHCGIAAIQGESARLRRREGFDLTDHGTDLTGALDEINYCILCHHQGRDSCSKGMADKKTGALALDWNDEIVKGSAVTKDGATVARS